MRLGFFQGEAADKSLSRIYPVQAKRETGSRDYTRDLAFFKKMPGKFLRNESNREKK
jgi:hypothetical protein